LGASVASGVDQLFCGGFEKKLRKYRWLSGGHWADLLPECEVIDPKVNVVVSTTELVN
jgi:hypothetical protein